MKSRLYLFLVLLLIQITGFASLYTSNRPQIIPRYDMQKYDARIEHIYTTLRREPTDNMAERISIISSNFLGQPYLLGATGEGPDAEFDKGPLYRIDAFDCTTFVEMTLALAQANNLQQFKSIIKKVRYKNGIVSYVDRNHFISADWNENNIKNGYIKDITDQFSVPYKVVDTQIDKPDWYKKLPMSIIKTFTPLTQQQANVLLSKLHAKAKQVKVVQGHVKYIPFSELYSNKNGVIVPNKKVFAQIPSGAIIEIVIPNRNLIDVIGTDINVFHMGFAMRTAQGLMFREASEIEKHVVDVPFIKYFQGYYLATHGLGGISIKSVV